MYIFNKCKKDDNFNDSFLFIFFIKKLIDTHIESGSELEEDEAGWDSPLTQLENDRQPSSRFIII